MIFFIIGLILFIISIILFIKTKDKVTNNNKIEKEKELLIDEIKEKNNEIKTLDNDLSLLQSKISLSQAWLDDQKINLNESFSSYVEILEHSYQEKEKEIEVQKEKIKQHGQKINNANDIRWFWKKS